MRQQEGAWTNKEPAQQSQHASCRKRMYAPTAKHHNSLTHAVGGWQAAGSYKSIYTPSSQPQAVDSWKVADRSNQPGPPALPAEPLLLALEQVECHDGVTVASTKVSKVGTGFLQWQQQQWAAAPAAGGSSNRWWWCVANQKVTASAAAQTPVRQSPVRQAFSWLDGSPGAGRCMLTHPCQCGQ